ncbi:hypothetical protein RHGRI_000635 [Rhododendron griersonianum]|uniref:Uncharacterized protein n=1 Tax=Rhododendron griersonianum TaxID=479676 RepID=A0AAV6LHS7_9ERIC|nr:hypothetical protein RHGRI_000635 [Rhododendron griersonianum]
MLAYNCRIQLQLFQWGWLDPKDLKKNDNPGWSNQSINRNKLQLKFLTEFVVVVITDDGYPIHSIAL